MAQYNKDENKKAEFIERKRGSEKVKVNKRDN